MYWKGLKHLERQLQYALVYLKNMGKEEDVLRMTVAGAMKTASYLPIEQKHGYLKLQVDASKFIIQIVDILITQVEP